MKQLLQKTGFKTVSALLCMLVLQVNTLWAQDAASSSGSSSTHSTTTTTTETWMAQPWVWVIGGVAVLLLLVLLLRGGSKDGHSVTITKTTDVV